MDENKDILYEPQMIGAVYYLLGKFNNRFSDRPEFISLVTDEMFSEPGLDRCHSASWKTLCAVFLDILNKAVSIKSTRKKELSSTLNGIGNLTRIMLNLEDYVEDDSPTLPLRLPLFNANYSNELTSAKDNLCAEYIHFVYGGSSLISLVCDAASEYLKKLNSCVFNLRYPANPDAHWNQSVGDLYDMRSWCFVDGSGTVRSDEKQLGQNILWSNYPKLQAKGIVGPGFYLLSDFDGYLLHSLYDRSITYYLSNPKINYEYGMIGTNMVLPSSSNRYRLGTWVSNGKTNIYYWYGNQWNIA